MSVRDYQRLTQGTLEQLILALAEQALGVAFSSLGEAPEGGREAAFHGQDDYRGEPNPWAGPGILYVLPHTNAEDCVVAVQHARLRWATADVSPHQVIVLPHVDEPVGGLLSIHEEPVDHHAPSSAVWDARALDRLLDAAPEVLRHYRAFLDTGDILGSITEALPQATPELGQALTSYLARELSADQFASLGQAGADDDGKTQLAQVFVDLPTARREGTELPAPGPAFTAALVTAAEDKYDLRSRQRVQSAASGGPEPGKYVLVGGPGQGKTTVGQFCSQLFRAALLQSRPAHLLTNTARRALTTVLEQGRVEDVPAPRARRLPFRITLTALADAIAEATAGSLLEYLAARVSGRTGFSVSTADLRLLLKEYPWLLVLDGLDEVPASSNRQRVLDLIADFHADVAAVNGDVLVLATTRPQGYNDEFSPETYQHRYLTPLSPGHALHYASRLIGVRFAQDPEKAERLLAQLQQASSHEATLRLLRTPLQVTIMSILIDRHGPPPQERFALFSDYYDVVYKRELAKDTPTSVLLRDHRKDIDTVHARMGLLLQLRSELTGETEARFSKKQFAALVLNRLVQAGWQEDEAARTASAVVEAALTRLVLLVPVRDEYIGFEIRSLQEFMAAEALIDGSDAYIGRRLRSLAVSSHWRNVFLFAAGKCRLEREYLLGDISLICAELNAGTPGYGPAARPALAGSVLALDLLEDLPPRSSPGFRRVLAQEALRLLGAPVTEVAFRLSRLLDVATRDLVEPLLRQQLSRAGGIGTNAWLVLAAALDAKDSWAVSLWNDLQPGLSPQARTFLLELALEFDQASLAPLCAAVAAEQGPVSVRGDASWHVGARPDLNEAPNVLDAVPWLQLANRASGRSRLARARRFRLTSGSTPPEQSERSSRNWPLRYPRGISVSLRLLSDTADGAVMQTAPSDFAPSWIPLFESENFSRSPSAESLAQILERVGAGFPPALFQGMYSGLPWPLAACLRWADNDQSLGQLAERLRAGDLGDSGDWRAAEDRWQGGVVWEDLFIEDPPGLPFTPGIASRGFPVGAATFGITWGSNEAGLSEMLEEVAAALSKLVGMPAGKHRRDLSHPLLWMSASLTQRAAAVGIQAELSTEGLLVAAEWRRDGPIAAHWLQHFSDADDAQVLDRLAACVSVEGTARRPEVAGRQPSTTLVEQLVGLVAARPDAAGLLAATATVLAWGEPLPPMLEEALRSTSNPEAARVGTLIRLMSGQVLPDLPMQLAKAFRGDAGLMLRIAGAPTSMTGALPYTVAELLTALGDDDWRTRRELARVLTEDLQSAVVALHSEETWRASGLPDGLRPLLLDQLEASG